MNKSQLISTTTALTMVFAASSNALADDYAERVIIEAQTSIQITDSFVRYADERYITPIYKNFKQFGTVSDIDCFDIGHYQNELSERYQNNEINIKRLQQQGAISSIRSAVLLYQNDRSFNRVLKKTGIVNEYCKAAYEGEDPQGDKQLPATVTATAATPLKSDIK